MPDYRTLVIEQEKLNLDLHQRMDDDVNLRDLMKYILRDNAMRPLSGIINITLNKPAVFYANIFAALNNAHENIQIETQSKSLDTHYIEDFRRAIFNAANTRLRKQGRFEIEPFIDEQSCMRGRAANLVLFQVGEDGKIRADIRSWDTRYVSYEIDDDGLLWAGINELRSMDLIKAQYPDEVAHFRIDVSTRGAQVLDVWHREGNEVWIGGVKILEQEHFFGFTPVVIEVVTLGSMLTDEDSFMRRGESIFFLVRDIIPQFNRLASIVATQTQTTVRPPTQTPSRDKSDEPPNYADIMDMGSSSTAGPEGFTQILETGDVNRAAGMLFQMISVALDEGGLSLEELGVLGSPPASGIALILAAERRAKTFLPRLELKSNLKLGIGDMATEQVKMIGGSVELDNRTFQVSKLEGQYQVKHKYTIQSKALDAGLATLAAAYGDLLSKEDKRTLLEREDPKGDEDRLNWEMVGLKYPIVQMRRDVESIIDLDKGGSGDEEAKLIIDSAGIALDKLLSGEIDESEPPETKEPTQVTSLFGGQAGRTQPQPPTEEV